MFKSLFYVCACVCGVAVGEEISGPKTEASQGFKLSREAFNGDDDLSHGSTHSDTCMCVYISLPFMIL